MLLWADDLAKYGGDVTKMLDGLWAELNFAGTSTITLDGTIKRTGTHSLKLHSTVTSGAYARRVFGGQKTTAGLGVALYLDHLPTINDSFGFQYLDQANAGQFRVFIQSTGDLVVKRADGTVLGSTTAPCVTANAFSHIEIKGVAGNAVAGAVEVRVNEITRINATGKDTINTANVEFSQVGMGCLAAVANQNMYFSDLFAWDDTADGTGLADFVGDKKAFNVMANADTAQADFAKSSGIVGNTLISEKPPVDASYIGTSTNLAVSEFGIETLPATIAEIIGVFIEPRALKDDAGTAKLIADLVASGVSTGNASKPVTTSGTYWPYPAHWNPNTGAPWTRAQLAAALLRFKRNDA